MIPDIRCLSLLVGVFLTSGEAFLPGPSLVKPLAWRYGLKVCDKHGMRNDS